MSTMTWKRSEWGYYADSPTDALRYYVRRDGSTWTLEVHRTQQVAGVTVVRKGYPLEVDRFHETKALAFAVAAAYDAEEPMIPGKPNRMTRAVGKAYAA